MSAEFCTELQAKGRREDYISLVKALSIFAVEQKDRYRSTRDCWYLDTYELNFMRNPESEEILNRAIEEYIDGKLDAKGNLCLSFPGPYGVWNGPFFDHTVPIFERLADAVPQVSFSGKITGWGPGSEEAVIADMKDGLLHLTFYYNDLFDDYDEDDYDEDDYDEDDYDEDDYDEDDEDDDSGIVCEDNLVSTEVYIPASRTYARGDSAKVAPETEDVCSSDADFEINKGILVKYIGNGATVHIPSSVKEIGDAAFLNCTSLVCLHIPASVKEINIESFADCSSLTDVYLQPGLKLIGCDAFRGCTSLRSVTIPDTVTEIHEGVFQGCSSLCSVFIPDSVEEIGWEAFDDCPNLTIYGSAGGYAEETANDFEIPFAVRE